MENLSFSPDRLRKEVAAIVRAGCASLETWTRAHLQQVREEVALIVGEVATHEVARALDSQRALTPRECASARSVSEAEQSSQVHSALDCLSDRADSLFEEELKPHWGAQLQKLASTTTLACVSQLRDEQQALAASLEKLVEEMVREAILQSRIEATSSRRTITPTASPSFWDDAAL